MRKYRTLSFAGACLLVSFGFPRTSLAISGCNNGYLSGTYNAQVSSAAFNNVIGTLNANAGLTFALKPNTNNPATSGTTGGTYGGLVGNGASLIGNVPSLGRYYFDGNGAIVGLSNYVPAVRMQVGNYSVANDCTVSIQLNSGESYGGIIVAQGQQVLFIESDTAGAGTTGTLSRAANSCSAPTSQQSFGFTYYGASAVDASVASTGVSVAPPTAMLTFRPFSAAGSITLDGSGGFTMRAFTTVAGGGVSLQSSSGTYTMTSDCSLSLKFNTVAAGGAKTGALDTPVDFSSLLAGTGNGAPGVLSVQNWQGGTATGMVIPQ
jgi:hypothetical protein